MTRSPVPPEAARAVCEMGRFFAARGSVPATSGNFSVRTGPRSAAITRSGVDKGELVPADVLAADIHSPPPEGSSAETALHLRLYCDRPEIQAIVHTHADCAAVISRLGGDVVLTGWELQKALFGVTSHEASVTVPVFQNDQDVAALAERVAARLAGLPGATAYLLAGHGLYAWGRSAEEARRHAVALEHLFSCELTLRRNTR
ncbi:MAG: methylthioribulose 1-phosphate dehydratase [Polyangiaceae bacterium]